MGAVGRRNTLGSDVVSGRHDHHCRVSIWAPGALHAPHTPLKCMMGHRADRPGLPFPICSPPGGGRSRTALVWLQFVQAPGSATRVALNQGASLTCSLRCCLPSPPPRSFGAGRPRQLPLQFARAVPTWLLALLRPAGAASTLAVTPAEPGQQAASAARAVSPALGRGSAQPAGRKSAGRHGAMAPGTIAAPDIAAAPPRASTAMRVHV